MSYTKNRIIFAWLVVFLFLPLADADARGEAIRALFNISSKYKYTLGSASFQNYLLCYRIEAISDVTKTIGNFWGKTSEEYTQFNMILQRLPEYQSSQALIELVTTSDEESLKEALFKWYVKAKNTQKDETQLYPLSSAIVALQGLKDGITTQHIKKKEYTEMHKWITNLKQKRGKLYQKKEIKQDAKWFLIMEAIKEQKVIFFDLTGKSNVRRILDMDPNGPREVFAVRRPLGSSWHLNLIESDFRIRASKIIKEVLGDIEFNQLQRKYIEKVFKESEGKTFIKPDGNCSLKGILLGTTTEFDITNGELTIQWGPLKAKVNVREIVKYVKDLAQENYN